MSINIDRTLPGLRKLLNQTLPWSALNSRTGETHGIRIDASKSTDHLTGLPPGVKIPVWEITLPDGVDLKANDTLTVRRAPVAPAVIGVLVGYYRVTLVTSPETYSVSTDGLAVFASRDSTSGGLGFDGNVTVVFKHSWKPGQTVTTDAFVYPADEDIKLYGLSPQLRDGILFGVGVAYPNGDLVSENDILISSAILGTSQDGDANTATITKPRRTVGVLAVARAYIAERG